MKEKKSVRKVSKTTSIQDEEMFDCGRCGTTHGKRSCPAFLAKCTRCKRRGHFQQCCKRKRTVNTIEKEEDGEELYVSSIEILSIEGRDSMSDWYEEILINGKAVQFKLDSVAQCNVISRQVAEIAKLKIEKSSVKKLKSFSNHYIRVVITKKKTKHYNLKLLVVQEKVQPVLGKDTCVQLRLKKNESSQLFPNRTMSSKELDV